MTLITITKKRYKNIMNNYYQENSKINVEVNGYNYTIFLDEIFQESAYERDVISILNNATTGDKVTFMINSDGGCLSSALPICIAIRESKAEVTGMLLAEAHSAASMVFLATDNQIVSNHCSMLVHSASYGTMGKQQDIVDHVKHTQKRLVDIFNDFYYGFLSESEIEEVLEGRQLFLNCEQISEKLKLRADIFQKEQDEFNEMSQPPSRQELMNMTKKQIVDLIHGEED